MYAALEGSERGADYGKEKRGVVVNSRYRPDAHERMGLKSRVSLA